MKVKLKLRPAQLKTYRYKDKDQQARYMAYLEDQHIARGRQEFKEARSKDPSIPYDFNVWFKAWNKEHMYSLRPKKGSFVNDHLMSMKWEDD
jgi:hypothetical protein